MRAIDLTAAHLGLTIDVPLGTERRQLRLAGLSFRQYDNTVRVTVRGPGAEYYDLSAHARVEIVEEAA